MSPNPHYKKVNSPQSVKFARYLIGEIQAGRIRQGEKFPSIRAYAEKFSLGRQIILSAFSILTQKNFVVNKARSGYYVNPEIKNGYYYRIGYFFNRLNPCLDTNLNTLSRVFARYGWTLIPGNNFEEDTDLGDWLKRKQDLDGVIVGGIVYEDLLRPLKAARMPYLVMGNYDLPQDIPQVKVTYSADSAKSLIQQLVKHDVKSIAIFIGEKVHYNDTLMGNMLQDALRSQLPGVSVQIVHTAPNGDSGLRQIMENPPDALYFLKDLAPYWRHYMAMHPHEHRPLVFVQPDGASSLLKSDFDVILHPSNASTHAYEESTAQKMLQILGALKD